MLDLFQPSGLFGQNPSSAASVSHFEGETEDGQMFQFRSWEACALEWEDSLGAAVGALAGSCR